MEEIEINKDCEKGEKSEKESEKINEKNEMGDELVITEYPKEILVVTSAEIESARYEQKPSYELFSDRTHKNYTTLVFDSDSDSLSDISSFTVIDEPTPSEILNEKNRLVLKWVTKDVIKNDRTIKVVNNSTISTHNRNVKFTIPQNTNTQTNKKPNPNNLFVYGRNGEILKKYSCTDPNRHERRRILLEIARQRTFKDIYNTMISKRDRKQYDKNSIEYHILTCDANYLEQFFKK